MSKLPEVEIVFRKYMETDSLRKVASQFGVSANAIFLSLKDYEPYRFLIDMRNDAIVERNRAIRQSNESVTQLAKQYDLSIRQIKRIRKDTHDKSTGKT